MELTFGEHQSMVLLVKSLVQHYQLLPAGSMTVGGLTYPTVNGTNGHVLTSDGAGNVTWQAQSGGGGGASVTISDTGSSSICW